ncbi:hypothetical protein ABT011_17225 [Streptomyces virginiae]
MNQQSLVGEGDGVGDGGGGGAWVLVEALGEGFPDALPRTVGPGPGGREAGPDVSGAGADAVGPGCVASPEGTAAPAVLVPATVAFAVTFAGPFGAPAVGASGTGAGCCGPSSVSTTFEARSVRSPSVAMRATAIEPPTAISRPSESDSTVRRRRRCVARRRAPGRRSFDSDSTTSESAKTSAGAGGGPEYGVSAAGAAGGTAPDAAGIRYSAGVPHPAHASAPLRCLRHAWQ